jgi:hypothetical protein
MCEWKVTTEDFSGETPILIEGLPGIGNVGKIVVDYLIDKYKAKKVVSYFSYDLPNSVFVTESNDVVLPTIDVYLTTINKQDFFFVTGDAQPNAERASYTLTQELLSFAKKHNVKQIVATGGIGLPEEPESPEVYILANKTCKKEDFSAKDEVFGTVGSVIGVSGLLVGLEETIPSCVLLVETFGHPMYIGIKESKTLLECIDKTFSMDVDYKDLDEEIISLDEQDEDDVTPPKFSKLRKQRDTNYIG